jgi:hypothetical protein
MEKLMASGTPLMKISIYGNTKSVLKKVDLLIELDILILVSKKEKAVVRLELQLKAPMQIQCLWGDIQLAPQLTA